MIVFTLSRELNIRGDNLVSYSRSGFVFVLIDIIKNLDNFLWSKLFIIVK